MTGSDQNSKATALTISAIVFAKNGKAFCDSRDIAEAFDKEHKHVLRDIRDMDCSVEFRRSNFGPNKIKDLTGESTSHVDITRDGFVFLVMGYTGEKAARIKEAFIGEFNRMEKALQSRRQSIRNRGKMVRNTYTETLKNHGCDKPSDYARATNSIYLGLYGTDATGLRREHNLPDKANIRDHMSEVGLAATLLSECLSSERIVATDRQGIAQCANASQECAGFIRGALVEERKSRKLIGSPT